MVTKHHTLFYRWFSVNHEILSLDIIFTVIWKEKWSMGLIRIQFLWWRWVILCIDSVNSLASSDDVIWLKKIHIGSGNDLGPSGNSNQCWLQATWTNVDLLSVRSCGISWEIFMISIIETCYKIRNLSTSRRGQWVKAEIGIRVYLLFAVVYVINGPTNTSLTMTLQQ